MNDWKNFLDRIYFQVNEPGSFSGAKKLQVILKQNGFNVRYDDVRDWLQSHDSYTLFKPTRYRFKRNRIVTTGLDYMWDSDLADMSNIKEHNDGFSYLLVVIDIFSRYLWLKPIKTKHGTEVKNAFEDIFNETSRRPARLRTDKGKEFLNRKVQQYMKTLDIKHFNTKNETKANYAERVIRTIKTLLYRYFHKKQSYRYIEILQDLVDNYNHRPHSSLENLSPSQINKENEAVVWKRMYIDTAKKSRRKAYKFKVNDKVRISHLKYQFQRDYHQKWTEEYFKIYHRIRRASKNMYHLRDLLDEDIDGYFYENELQKINKEDDQVFRIEKVIRKRKKGKEILVKYMGWPDKFNAWINAENVQRF